MQCSPFHLSQLHPQLSCLPSYYCWSTQNFFHNSLELGRILSQVNFNSPSLHNGQALGVNGATVSRFSVPKICRHQLHYPHREVLGPLLLHLKHLVFLPVEQPHQLHHFSSFCMKAVFWMGSHLQPLHQFISLCLFLQHLVQALYPQLIYPQMSFRWLVLCYSLLLPESLLQIPAGWRPGER